MNLDEKQKKQIIKGAVWVLGTLSLFLVMTTINAIKEFSYIGKGTYATNVISVSGTGEVMAIPDVATFSFSVTENAKQVSEAQNKSAAKMNKAMELLKGLGIDEKDIKTENYSSYPKYEWQNSVCPTSSIEERVSYCPSGKQVLVGYEVSQTVSVKVRDTEKAGEVLSKVGGLEVENISGLDFVVDDSEKVKAEAREKAINNAKEKAKVLAKALGVKLVKVTSFYESNNGDRVYASYDAISSKGMGGESAVVPQIATGENKFVSNVSITYEIK